MRKNMIYIKKTIKKLNIKFLLHTKSKKLKRNGQQSTLEHKKKEEIQTCYAQSLLFTK